MHDVSGLCDSLNDALTTVEDSLEQGLEMTDGVPHSSPRFSRTTSSRRIGDNGVQKLATVLRDNRSLVTIFRKLGG